MVTLEEVKKAEAEYNEVQALKKQIDQRLEEKQRRYFGLSVAFRKVCTHKYPDGKTAWENCYAYGFCNICGLDDL